tara:strand:- start:350 stop:826 length:477 start_codon:yes stop_codon:yes gene_type:complete
MKAKISVFFLVILLTIFIVLPALYNNILISESISLKNEENLSVTDTIKFKFDHKKDMEVNMNIFFRVNQDYESYSNLFLFTYLINNELNDTISIDTLEYEIYDNFGVCLGSGPSDIKTFDKVYKKNHMLKKGNYSLNIVHGMYSDLTGLDNIGFNISK